MICSKCNESSRCRVLGVLRRRPDPACGHLGWRGGAGVGFLEETAIILTTEVVWGGQAEEREQMKALEPELLREEWRCWGSL